MVSLSCLLFIYTDMNIVIFRKNPLSYPRTAGTVLSGAAVQKKFPRRGRILSGNATGPAGKRDISIRARSGVVPVRPDPVHPVSRSTKNEKKEIGSAIKKKIRPQHLTSVL